MSEHPEHPTYVQLLDTIAQLEIMIDRFETDEDFHMQIIEKAKFFLKNNLWYLRDKQRNLLINILDGTFSKKVSKGGGK